MTFKAFINTKQIHIVEMENDKISKSLGMFHIPDYLNSGAKESYVKKVLTEFEMSLHSHEYTEIDGTQLWVLRELPKINL